MKTQIGISISDLINRRLVEGVAAQLGLLPILLEEAELGLVNRIAGIEILIADEARALRFYQSLGLPKDLGHGIGPH